MGDNWRGLGSRGIRDALYGSKPWPALCWLWYIDMVLIKLQASQQVPEEHPRPSLSIFKKEQQGFGKVQGERLPGENGAGNTLLDGAAWLHTSVSLRVPSPNDQHWSHVPEGVFFFLAYKFMIRCLQ